jgi:hypothetical protein
LRLVRGRACCRVGACRTGFLTQRVAGMAVLGSDRGVRVKIPDHGGGVVGAVELVAGFRSSAAAVAGCGVRRGNPGEGLLMWAADMRVDGGGGVDG